MGQIAQAQRTEAELEKQRQPVISEWGLKDIIEQLGALTGSVPYRTTQLHKHAGLCKKISKTKNSSLSG